MVEYGQMLKETREAWTRLCERLDFIDISKYDMWMPTEVAAILWFWLREVADSPADFPHGKWASLQVFQDLIAAAAKSEFDELKLGLESRWGC
jgi:hypothetical protein